MKIDIYKYYSLKRSKLLTSLILVLLSAVFMKFGFIQEIELKFLDYKFQHLSGDLSADSNIVIISIDDQSLDFFAQNGVSWPWPRSFYAHVVDYLTQVGAESIVFDMLFTHMDADRSETDAEENDSLFALALERSQTTILGMAIKEWTGLPQLGDGPILLRPSASLQEEPLIELPIPILERSSQGVGHTNIKPDADGIFRHVAPFILHRSGWIPNLAMAAFLSQHGDQSILEAGLGRLPEFGLKASARHQLINWYGPAGAGGTFKYFPFSAVVQSASAMQFGGTPALPAETFSGKSVVIGADASGLRDLKATPVMKNGLHPGMEVWATVLSNLKQQDFINPVNPIFQYLLLLLISFSLLLVFDKFSASWGYLLLAVELLLYSLLAILLWKGEVRTHLSYLPVLIVVLGSYLVVISNEMRERLFLRRVFGPYVAPELMDLMYKTREVPELGGQQVDGSAFFSDLQGFTGFSEQLTPAQLVALLNEYLTSMTDTLMSFRGTLDKYEGDAIIAFFGAPVPDPDHKVQAVHAAIHMQNALAELREKWASEGDTWPSSIREIQMRIGVNSGDMLVGNVGSAGRMNYTMMGDTVNVAARLESSAKQYGVLTHISENTAESLPENIARRRLGATLLMGKANAAVSYEVLGFREDLSENDLELLDLWPHAMDAIRHQDWDKAETLLKQTLVLERDYSSRPTNPSRVYLEERIPFWKTQDLPADWDGVWIFRTK